MDHAALYAELTTDPAGVGYAGKTDAERAALLNAETRDGWRDVAVGEVVGYALLNLMWPGIEDLAGNVSADATARNVARSAIALLTNPAMQTVQLSDPTKRTALAQMLGVLVLAGAITQAQSDGVLALGRAKISRAQELGLGAVTPSDVADAMRVIP